MDEERKPGWESHSLTAWINRPKWNGSIILCLIDWTTFLLSFLCPLPVFAFFYSKRYGESIPSWMADIWLLGLLLIEGFALAFVPCQATGRAFLIACGIGALVLFDNAMALARDVFLIVRIHSGDFVINDKRRWVAATGICAAQIPLAFALVFMVLPIGSFNQDIKGALDSIYFSLVTFATVGYGDFSPKSDPAKCLAILELVFVIAFLSVKLPVAAAVLLVNIKSRNLPPVREVAERPTKD